MFHARYRCLSLGQCMGFHFNAERNTTPPRVLADEDSASVRVRVGNDDEGHSYHLVVSLDPDPTGQSELNFSIVQYRDSFDPEHVFYQSSDVAGVIDRKSREKIRSELQKATKLLINTVRPRSIVLRAPQTNLPEKALIKYYLLVQVILSCDYTARLLAPLVWCMERSDLNTGTA